MRQKVMDYWSELVFCNTYQSVWQILAADSDHCAHLQSRRGLSTTLCGKVLMHLTFLKCPRPSPVWMLCRILVFPPKIHKNPPNHNEACGHILWITDYYIATVIMRPEWIKWYDRCEESRLFVFLASLILHSLRCWWENIESRKTSELSTALEKSKSCDSRPLTEPGSLSWPL